MRVTPPTYNQGRPIPNRVAVLYGPRDLRIELRDFCDQPAEGQVLVQVKATGICGSDIHLFTGQTGLPSQNCYPVIPGHEFVCSVLEVGAHAIAADGTELRPGMRIAVDPAEPCGRCYPCQAGWENLCERMRFCGSERVDGSLQDLMILDGHRCWPLPDSVSNVEGVLLEPLGVALHAVQLAQPSIGDVALVLGAGPIGLLSVQVLLLAGVDRVFVVEPLDWRLEFAVRLGAVPLCGSGDELEPIIRKATGGRGADVAIEAAWGGEAVTLAAKLVKPGGRIVLIGIPADDTLAVSHSLVRRKGLTLRLCRRMHRTYGRALALVTQGRVKLRDYVTHTFSFDQAKEAFEWASSYPAGTVKVVIEQEMQGGGHEC